MKFRKSAIKELSETTGVELSKKSDVEEKNGIVFVDKKPYFFIYKERTVPTLHALKSKNFLSFLRIDQGAVKFLIKGADMMRPGIIEFQEFKSGEVVSVLGPNSDIPIGLGEALFDSETAKSMDSGKILKTLHYTGDSIWNASLL